MCLTYINRHVELSIAEFRLFISLPRTSRQKFLFERRAFVRINNWKSTLRIVDSLTDLYNVASKSRGIINRNELQSDKR